MRAHCAALMVRLAVIWLLMSMLMACSDPSATEDGGSNTSGRSAPVELEPVAGSDTSGRIPAELEPAYRKADWAFHSLLHCSGALAGRRDKLLSDLRRVEQDIAARFGGEELRRLRLALADSQHMVMIPPCAGMAGADAFASAVKVLETIAQDPARNVAAEPALSKDAQLTPKHKPVVMDLGGAQAAQAVGCALTVRFGSIGTGTDTVAGAQIRRLIEEDPGVAQIERFIVGREGETVTCIRLKAEVEADHLFDKLREAAADAYLVTIWSKSGREFHSPRKRL